MGVAFAHVVVAAVVAVTGVTKNPRSVGCAVFASYVILSFIAGSMVLRMLMY